MAQQAGFQTYRAVFCGKIGHKTELSCSFFNRINGTSRIVT